MGRFVHKRLLPTLLISVGLSVGFSASLVSTAMADSKIEFQAKKLNAEQLLKKQGQAVAFIHKAFKALPKDHRGKSAPFLKSLAATAKNIKQLSAAAKAKDGKTFAATLPVLAQSIAQLNQTYRLAKLKDKKIAVGVETLNKAWRQYLKRVKGGKAKNDKELAKANGRRIKDMQRRLDKMAQNKMNAREKRELERLRKLLDKAQANNRKADQQWYTSIILADFAGYYAGYYYYYTAYDPSYATFYRDSWEYFSTEVSYSYQESYSYYESYSWESYEQTVETSESYDFEQTSEEYNSFEAEYEQTEETVDTAVEEEYQATDEDKAIDTAEDYDSDEKVDDVGDNPDPEADAQSEVEDDSAAADDNSQDDQAYLNDDASDEAAAPDDSGDDDSAAPADDNNDDNAAAPDDNNDDNAAAPDDNNDDQAAPDDNGGDDNQADDNGGDDNAADDNSGGDDGGGDDNGGGDDDGG